MDTELHAINEQKTIELAERISLLLEKREFHSVRDLLIWLEPADIAEIISSLPADSKAIILRILPRELASPTFEYLDVEQQKTLLNALGDSRVAIILDNMSADDRTALLEEFPAQAAKKLIQLLSKDERSVALSLLGYPEGSVGRLMNPEYIAVSENLTVIEVLEYIRENGAEGGNFDHVFITDAKGKLVDDLAIRDILLAKFGTKLSELTDHQFVALAANDDQETATQTFKKYDRTSLPVVDSQGHLLGVVTIDDVIDVIEAETTEDIQKLGAVEALEQAYIKTPVGELVRKRASWLVLLMIGEMLTATAMGFFEGEIARAVVLALFIPLIISSGGNSGSQAATLIIRALAVGEIGLGDWGKVLQREVLSGLSLGVVLGTIGFLRIAIWSSFVHVYGPHWFVVGVTVGLSLIVVVLWGVVVGAMLPFALKRFGFDPATSSAPFVATLVDVTGLIIYFSIAAWTLHGTLL